MATLAKWSQKREATNGPMTGGNSRRIHPKNREGSLLHLRHLLSPQPGRRRLQSRGGRLLMSDDDNNIVKKGGKQPPTPPPAPEAQPPQQDEPGRSRPDS